MDTTSRDVKDDAVIMPEEAFIEISRDKMEAIIRFKPPFNNGKMLSKDDIKRLIAAAGVKYGLIDGIIDRLTEFHEYGESSYTLAKGVLPENGVDGYTKYLVDLSKKNVAPKILENGKADFHKLGLIVLVEKDQELALSVPPTKGSAGTNVLGISVPCKQGRQAPRLPIGKNTSLSNDGNTLYASCAGQVILKDNKITVIPVLEIKGNVGVSTGDIDFNGTVIVKGSVMTDFSINARGDVEIHGTVEGAKITSENNIVLYSGVQGMDKAVIKAGGTINLKFASNCTLEAGQNIIADSILHSTLKCGGFLELTGKNGKLVGGSSNVKERVTANEIGSSVATATMLEVGHDPDTLEKYKELMKKYNSIKKEYDNLTKIVESLKEQNKNGALNEDKKNYLLKIIHTRVYTREKLSGVQKEINEVKQNLGDTKGEVCAHDRIRAGVKVLIGNAVLYVKDEILNCKLTNEGSKIVIGNMA